MSAPLEGGTSLSLLQFMFVVQKTCSVLYSPVEGPVLHLLECLEIYVNKFYIWNIAVIINFQPFHKRMKNGI